MRAADFPYLATPFAALAHRGGPRHPDLDGKENTVRAFRHATDLGYKYLETDVCTSRDGVLFAFHDESLERVSNGRGRVQDHSSDELRRLRVDGTDPIPTLDELLETFPTSRFNIDIKQDSAMAPLVRTIDHHRAHDRVLVGSFSASRLRAFRRMMGRRVATAVSPIGGGWNAFVPLLPRLLNSPGAALQLPASYPVAGRDLPLITKRLIRHAHAIGKVVHAWTIDDEDQMIRLIDAGIDGIFTDRTDVLKAVLIDRGLWED